MSPSPIIARTGLLSAHRTPRRAWLTLAAVALAPGWAAASIVPGFFSANAPPPLSDGAPNLWAIVSSLSWIADLPLAGLAMATAIGAAAWLAAYFSAHPPRHVALLRAALLVSLVLPGLLPAMRSGDFLLAVALSGALAFRERDFGIAALIVTGWLLAIAGFAAIGAPPIMVATLLIARAFLASPANDNGPPLNPFAPYPA